MKTMITMDDRSPDRATCMKALEEFGTPANVIGHCRAVAAVGYVLGKAIDSRRRTGDTDLRKPEKLDLDLILAAGLLHDIARVQEEHWIAGADFCMSKGWAREADIVRQHMKYDHFNSLEEFNETDIVCLADRLVMEDNYVGLEKRMEYIINKARRLGHEEHIPYILKKKEETKKLIAEIEEYLGRSLDDLMSGIDYEHPEK